MLLVSLVTAAGWAASVSLLIRHVASQQRAHARREDLLTNQLLHAVGKPWQQAPADDREPAAKPEPRTWTATPDQHPVY